MSKTTKTTTVTDQQIEALSLELSERDDHDSESIDAFAACNVALVWDPSTAKSKAARKIIAQYLAKRSV